MTHRTDPVMPRSPFALLPLRSGTLFPGTTLTLPVGRTRSVALLDDLGAQAILGVVTQRDPSVTDPGLGDLHEVGTLARIVQVERTRDRGYRVVLEGLSRFRLTGIARSEPYWLAEGEALEDETADAAEARLLAQSLKQHVTELAARNGGSLGTVQADETDPGLVADQVAALLGLPSQKEIEVLREAEVGARLRLVASLVAEARALNDIKSKIDQDVRREVNRNQRDALLREQIRAMKKEIGDEPDGDSALSALKKKLDDAELPEEARSVADRELRRLESMAGQQAEAHVIRTYLELIADLPWSKRSVATDDVDAVSRQLDADHAGLDDVKKRILEHMAVLKLTGSGRGTILCLAGPPGVGKTSLGQSIADATGRPFVRISLGGVRDEAEIRGHRRTYVGALPGRVIAALKKAKARNAVVLLDEIDKLTSGWGGSPEAALLEVLDPEQNKTFTDHYLEIPFDLSEVLFLCTANDLGAISAPLRDRMEIIELQGYTTEEKVQIARQHLVPKQRKEHAIPEEVLTFTDEALRTIARDYTREAGVRQLTREITRITRAVALEVARATDQTLARVVVDAPDVAKYLGRAKFFSEVAERTAAPGVATGLAWTPVGGDILFIETSRMPGKGALEITGQLGDVMKESARAALTYVRSHAEELGVPTDAMEKHDVHIHVPAGAVPKDGPSAGVTMFTALTSLLTGRRVRPDTAMTGECTLRGKVMPVGGIKAKVLAAHRAGITRVILPARNERDLEEIPASVREAMEFIFADDMREVLAAALEPAGNAGDVLVPPAATNDNATARTAA
ncbi:MAG: endopeptidase La [Deltaproteobacteria bacterium]|nr:endopeptidase La [Deltaproteobacteria bacterium]